MPSCLVCQQAIEPFLSFGRMPRADAFITPEEIDGEFFFHLAAGRCGGCGMVQLCERVPDALMFHDTYAYYSSTSAGMQRHFARFAGEVQQRLGGVVTGVVNGGVTSGAPFVVEIGCNDGILLEGFAKAGIRHLGLDPAGNVVGDAVRKGLTVRQAFFTEATAADIVQEHGRADAIVAANVICHVADIHSVFAGVRRLLSPEGLFIFEDPYIGAILEANALDQFYDEHVFYFSAASVQHLAAMHDFEIVDISPQPVHGGELRYTLARRGAHRPTPESAAWLEREAASGLSGSLAPYAAFAVRAAAVRDELTATVRSLRAAGHRIVGYGATAKSATLINYCGFGPADIEYIADVTPGKQRKLTPGAHIEVRPPDAFRSNPPAYALLFAWNHEAKIRAKEAWFEEGGGRWITYVPAVRIL